MIIDQLSQLQKYVHIHPVFQKAVAFIESNDLDTLNPGEITIDETLRIIVIHDQLVAKEISIDAFECHNANIDIQIILEGSETVGWKPRNTCHSPKGIIVLKKMCFFSRMHLICIFNYIRGNLVYTFQTMFMHQ